LTARFMHKQPWTFRVEAVGVALQPVFAQGTAYGW
jgi:hypothetical protein